MNDDESVLVGELVTRLGLRQANCSNHGLIIVNDQVRRRVEAEFARLNAANATNEQTSSSATERVAMEEISLAQRLVNNLNPNGSRQNGGELRLRIADGLDRLS
jgi:hypothetical protein